MAPGAEGTYTARLIACHACAEREKARLDLQEAPAEAGIHIHLDREPHSGEGQP